MITPTIETFINDIPEDIARHAHRGTSFDPELRSRQEREGYAQTLVQDFANLAKHADTEEKRCRLIVEFERYRQSYRTKTVAMLAAKSRCLSTMIAGPSNFNTRRAGKASDSADKRTEELIEFRKRAIDAIRKTLTPELQPIMSGDADAAERLEDKITKAEKLQARMKAANFAIKRHAKEGADAQVSALIALGLPESIARALLVPDFAGRIGFPGYELTNNAANIRRMKGRLTVVEQNHATPETIAEGAHARFEDAPAENRVRLFFPGKPELAVRDKLKSRGFRWTPSAGCWGAYRNYESIRLAKEIAGVAEDAAPIAISIIIPTNDRSVDDAIEARHEERNVDDEYRGRR